jgi:Fe-S cluster assembly protein SufD
MTETTLPVVTGEFASAYAPEHVAAAARERGEPDWLVDARAEAARAFAATPMPTTRLRPWKYTDVSDLEIGGYAPADLEVTVADGVSANVAGTLVEALADAGEAEHVRTHLGSVVAATEGKFVAANAALWNDGVYVRAGRGQAIEAPVIATLRAEGDRTAVAPRVLVVAEAQAEVTVVLRCTSDEAADLLVPGVIEVVAEQGAQVRLLLDIGWGSATREFSLVRARVERDANVRVGALATGGRIVKVGMEGLLDGEGASASFRGAVIGDSDQHFDFVTLQNHTGPRTVSEVNIRAALSGASKAVYYGITRVEEGASGASAEQENRNLLLSKRATANSDPVLEILTNEVIRCGHGATVGPVDQEALFYLQSRGLNRRQALTLIVTGFLHAALDGVDDAGLTEELERQVDRKLAVAEL